MASFFDFVVKDAQGKDFPLNQQKGQLTLVVNVASRCGFTPQYTGLEDLQKKFGSRGFRILAFPCNQFGAQEPGSNEEIQQFCQLNYQTSFPVLAKVDVNGTQESPVYHYLKSKAPGILGTEAIKWNFTKFLVGPDGTVLNRYAPQTKPEEIAADIEKHLPR